MNERRSSSWLISVALVVAACGSRDVDDYFVDIDRAGGPTDDSASGSGLAGAAQGSNQPGNSAPVGGAGVSSGVGGQPSGGSGGSGGGGADGDGGTGGGSDTGGAGGSGGSPGGGGGSSSGGSSSGGDLTCAELERIVDVALGKALRCSSGDSRPCRDRVESKCCSTPATCCRVAVGNGKSEATAEYLEALRAFRAAGCQPSACQLVCGLGAIVRPACAMAKDMSGEYCTAP